MGNSSVRRRRIERRSSVLELIQAALDRSPGNYTMEDVRDAITNEGAQLWTGEGAAAVTEDSKVFHVWLAGGDMEELFKMLEGAEARKKAEGFDLVTVSNARKGWERAMKHLGYERRVMLVKEL